MVHGSGNESRTGNMPVAERLAERGVAALVYDKRGTGGSGGDWHEGDFVPLAEDARTRAATDGGASSFRAALVGTGWWLVCATAPLLALAPGRFLPDKGLVRFFARTRNFDPLPAWRRVRQPVLGLWGSADEAVP